jgi:drug/metabolite transporter (DMT)-like permease
VVTQFALLATAWGASFLFIKVGLRGLSPAQVVWARMVFGATALGLLVVLQRRPVPRDARLWGHLTVVAVLLCIAPFLLFAWAEQHISSGLASILNATTPLLAMLLAAVALPEEKFTRAKTLGLLLGFAGVVTITGAWQGLDVRHDGLAQLACLGATTCYGLAFVYLRRCGSSRRSRRESGFHPGIRRGGPHADRDAVGRDYADPRRSRCCFEHADPRRHRNRPGWPTSGTTTSSAPGAPPMPPRSPT